MKEKNNFFQQIKQTIIKELIESAWSLDSYLKVGLHNYIWGNIDNKIFMSQDDLTLA